MTESPAPAPAGAVQVGTNGTNSGFADQADYGGYVEAQIWTSGS